MWIVTFDTDFYPRCKIYDSYEEALELYGYMVEEVGDEDAVYIAEIKDSYKGEDYEPINELY